MNVPIVSLGEVAVIERQGLHPSAIPEGANYLGLEHIESGGRILGAVTVANGELASTKFRFGPDHILYGKLRPYLAKIALPDFDGVCSTDILPVRPGPRMDRNYLAHFLRQPRMVDFAASRSTGVNLPRLSPKALAEFEIPLPPLEEQKRIAAILDQADALRRLRRRALERLNTLGQAIFYEMFGAPETWSIRFPLEKLETICRPKQWKTISAKDLEDEGYPVYGANGVIGYFNAYNHEAPTVLITCRGATCGTINVCAPKSYVTGNAMALDDPDPQRVSLGFLEWSLKFRGVDDAITGSAQPQITRQSLSSVTIPLPELEQQEAFSERLSAIAPMMGTLRRSADELDCLFTSLQHRAFRGDL